ncbi:MAG: nitrilase-related carbon-nitrogen hydrolase [Chloroflexota bacterium]|jgi:predicted amidohydrolase|nr:nitrilase-related carbon-nitrogen hydrolase [Chloroflexota bacterium]
MKIKIALAQINTTLGDVKANLEKHMGQIEAAKENGADLLIFPELSLTGYALQDLAVASALRPHQEDPVFNDLLHASQDIDLMVGFVHEDHRHRFYIASAYLSKGDILHIHNKVCLPTYGMFDEGRFFAPGDSVHAFNTRFGRMGMLICEDFWHASLPYLLWLDGADILLFASASPGRGLHEDPRLSSSTWVEHTNRAYAGLFTNFVAHANKVGYEDGLNFWGGSTIFDPNGDLVVRAPDFEEALTFAEIDLNQLHRSRARLPLLRDERTDLVLGEMKRILGEK